MTTIRAIRANFIAILKFNLIVFHCISNLSTTDSKIKFDSNWSKGIPRDENRGKSIHFN
jgi:hypothetical protein